MTAFPEGINVYYIHFSIPDYYPLILIVGREPNCDQPICNTVGIYDFRKSSRCGFWNASYALAARVVNLTTGQLKQRCIQLNGSPLLYADAMPQGLLNSVPNKRLQRENIEEEAIRIHIANIFRKPILRRVVLVILSGLRGCVFALPKTLIADRCKKLGIQCTDLPFFCNQNAPQISQELDRESRTLLSDVVSRFLGTA